MKFRKVETQSGMKKGRFLTEIFRLVGFQQSLLRLGRNTYRKVDVEISIRKDIISIDSKTPLT